MAKVGRASRNSSLMRVEALDGTADKTIAAAESGEVYLLRGDPAADRTITLPPAKEGAYIKVVVVVEADTASWIIKTAATSSLLYGAVLAHVDSSDATTDVFSDGSDDTQIELKDDTNPGTVLEFMSDGTHWVVTGHVICDTVPEFS